MKKVLLLVAGCWMLVTGSSGQSISKRVEKAFGQFEADSQLKHAISSLYIINAMTGEVVFDKNSQVGMAPASTQKIITSVTAFELLGKDFRYETSLVLDKTDGNNILRIFGYGDPTLGSWRWSKTSTSEVMKRWVKAIQLARLKKIDVVIFESGEWNETIPDGWIWQDIGNYYGAGADGFNWRENQYDILLQSSENKENVKIVKTVPFIYDLELESLVRSAAKGTGDNAYVYYPFDRKGGLIRGTIPVGEKDFRISAALPSPRNQFFRTIADTLKRLNIKMPGEFNPERGLKNHTRALSTLHTERSPSLDSIIYWFNKKSINLYGEALIKTFGMKSSGVSSTDSGVAVLKNFWKDKGLHANELNMYDGSGLSPLNRVTTHAQVEILKYAKTRDWFPYFYDALPEYNGMKLKSGTISDVKGYCGYHKAKDGNEYIVSFLVNNYSGRSSVLVGKMYKVLDELK